MRSVSNQMSIRNALAVAFAAGAATTALSDDCCRWELRIERTAITSNNFEVELWAHIPDDAHAFNAGVLDLMTDGVEWIDVGSCLLGGGASDPGTIVGDDVMGIVVGQVHLPPSILANDDNPIRVWCGEFEATDGAAFRTIETMTDTFRYYTSATTSERAECDPAESVRTVFVDPLVVDDWLAVPFEGTSARSSLDALLIITDLDRPGVGAAIDAEDAPWAPGTRFEHHVDLDDLAPGAPVETSWFPWWTCGGFTTERLSATMTKQSAAGEPPTVTISLNFEEVGTRRVPLTLELDGRVVATPILGSGASFRLIDPCIELTWCYVMDTNDQLVLVLKCENPFDFLVGGERYRADTVRMAPGIGSSAYDGLDRVEVRSLATSLTIGGEGFVDGTEPECPADCDENGRLDIFDFLCFQNLFAAGDAAADLDGDGQLTIFDFLAFQNEFSAGCP